MAELTATLPVRQEYKDVSLTFAKNPVTADVVSVINEDAVKRSLRMILLTRTGEAPFFPNFGSRVHELLFEPVDPISSVLLQNEIRDTIAAFEPRVNLNTVLVTPRADEQGYDVNIEFNLRTQTRPLTITLYLSRLR